MCSRFAAVCQTFDDQKQNREMCDAVIAQFMRLAGTDPESLSAMATDPMLVRFLKIAFSTVTREQFPAPSEGIIPPVYLQILQFLTTLGYNNPDLLSAIAAAAPLDQLPDVFFGRNITNDRIVDPQSSHLLSSLRFLLCISCSHSVEISSTGALHTLFAALFSLFNVQPLSALAVATVSGLAHNCPSAVAFIRSLPNFGRLRSELVALLSSNDHSVVVAAMSAITGLFNVGEDAVTLARLAVKAIKGPPPLPMCTALCTWTLLDVASVASMSKKTYASLVKAMLGSQGMRSLQIMTFLAELQRMGLDYLPVLREKRLFLPVIDFVIHSKWDFVTAAGAQFIQTLTEDETHIEFGEEIVELFASALEFVITAGPGVSLLQLESMLVLLRVFMKSEGTDREISEILGANQGSLLTGFQRHIESNHSFVSVSYFLFLVDCLPFYKSWSVDMVQVIAETQFNSLLVHVLTHSSNRSVLHDACKAAALIAVGIVPDARLSPLMDSLVSGFLAVNRAAIDEKAKMLDGFETMRCELGQKIKAAVQERDDFAVKCEQLTKAKNESDNVMTETGGELAVAREQIAHLKEQLRMKTRKGKDRKINVMELTKELAELRVEMQHREQTITELQQTIVVLKTRIRGFKDVEAQLRDMTQNRDELARENQNLNKQIIATKDLASASAATAENEKTGRRQTETQLLEISSQLSAMTIKYREQEVHVVDTEKQMQKLQGVLKKKTERLTAAEEINRNLRNQVNELQEQLAEAAKSAKKQHKKYMELSQQLTDIETRNRDHATLQQFIHKITEKKGVEDENSLEDTAIDSLSASESADPM